MNNLDLTYEAWNDQDVSKLEGNFKDYFEVLKWAYQNYDDEIVYACSFGAEGSVLIDLISKVKKDAKVVFLDTHLHFKETYDVIEKTRKRYPHLKLELMKPELTLEEQSKAFGDELWTFNPNKCCEIRKIVPLKKALKGNKAWISGLRREQSPSRANVNYINKDDKFGLIKICPLIHWTWEDVWTYIKLNNLPYHKLHDRGYPSIGCYPCTNPVDDQNDIRSGRWSNFSKTECGLHSN